MADDPDTSPIRVGCAGWTLPKADQAAFGEGASHLERYASRFPASEINSSFHRPHEAATYARWAGSVPPAFRFSVKLPKAITHQQRLKDCAPQLGAFLQQVRGLGDRLGCLLVQLPPSLDFDASEAGRFFRDLRSLHAGNVALEPRHGGWFTPEADAMLSDLAIARVLADPVRHDAGRWPGGWPRLVYLRLHGSPRVYYSAYEPELITALARRLLVASKSGADVWCIFDNTAGQAAAANALCLLEQLAELRSTSGAA